MFFLNTIFESYAKKNTKTVNLDVGLVLICLCSNYSQKLQRRSMAKPCGREALVLPD